MLLELALTFPMFEQQGLLRFGQLAGAHGCITGSPVQPLRVLASLLHSEPAFSPDV